MYWFFLFFLDFLFLFIFFILRKDSYLTEKIYYKKIYSSISFIFSSITDFFSFSLTEILIIIFTILGIFFSFYLCFLIFNGQILEAFLLFGKVFFNILSFIFIWFYFFWGFNYFKKSLFNNNYHYSLLQKDVLIEKAIKLTELLNSLFPQEVLTEKEINSVIDKELKEYLLKNFNIKIKIAKKVKKSFTGILEYLNISGIISPFFLESHISRKVLPLEKPWLIAHEKAHLYGITDEKDANMIAFYVCNKVNNNYIKFSGYFTFFCYLLKVIEERLEEGKMEYENICNKLKPEVKKLVTQRDKRYKDSPFITKVIMKFYDIYLKFNKIKQGINSYFEAVVFLILNKNL